MIDPHGEGFPQGEAPSGGARPPTPQEPSPGCWDGLVLTGIVVCHYLLMGVVAYRWATTMGWWGEALTLVVLTLCLEVFVYRPVRRGVTP